LIRAIDWSFQQTAFRVAFAVQGKVAADKRKGRSPGFLTHLVLYAVAVTVLHMTATAEIKDNFDRHARDFHIAALNLRKDTNEARFRTVALADLRAGKVDLASVSFLLPESKIEIPSSDLHDVRVLERHPDWQLVEYRYGNTHDSTSRYRAFKDRIEPLTYRLTMDPGLFFSALLLILPVMLVAALINAFWRFVDRRRQ
jgi:hypothetical protein